MSTTHPDPITMDYSTLTDALAPWLERRVRVEVICTSHGDPEWPVAQFDGLRGRLSVATLRGRGGCCFQEPAGRAQGVDAGRSAPLGAF